MGEAKYEEKMEKKNINALLNRKVRYVSGHIGLRNSFLLLW